MFEYRPPIRDMTFVLHELADLEGLRRLPGCDELGDDLVDSIFEQAGRFASSVLSPLNQPGDRHGARLDAGEVRTAPGWRAAYSDFVAGGWCSLSAPPELGGQGLPRALSSLVEEMWNASNVSFALCPMLTRGAVEAIESRGSEALRTAYLRKLVGGEWTGTMNLTEPDAGSDLAAVSTRAVPQSDGTHRITGQKIFITYGEHDLTDNIVHLVLARTPGAPQGVKGISLFVVPKFLTAGDGSLGRRNDVRCVSLEHKLGIHASPTATLSFGDEGGAVGYLVGEENRGLEIMFIMMNEARFSVGLEGVGLSDRAYQRAVAYARERLQGTEVGSRASDRVAILRHPDVRRMLLLMRAQVEAMRALSTVVAASMDRARLLPDPDARAAEQAFVDLMIPVVKGWCTESATDVASIGIQVHGGMGYVEETGAAQDLRDARITSIYEGTTGIQANDFVGRKVARDGGQAIRLVLAEMNALEARLREAGSDDLTAVAGSLAAAREAVEDATRFVVGAYAQDVRGPFAGAVPFLKAMGIASGGWQLARAALVCHRRLHEGRGDAGFHRAKIRTARFYADHLLPMTLGHAHAVVHGAAPVLAFEDEHF